MRTFESVKISKISKKRSKNVIEPFHIYKSLLPFYFLSSVKLQEGTIYPIAKTVNLYENNNFPIYHCIRKHFFSKQRKVFRMICAHKLALIVF